MLKVNEPVSVSLFFDEKTKKVFPKWVVWKGRLYPVLRLGLHHKYREGRTLFHVFSVVSKTVFFKLKLDSETLHWRLEGVSDRIFD